MVKHQVQINISGDSVQTRDVLEYRRLTLKDKVLRALLSRGQRVLVLIPSSSVQTVTIKEVEGDRDG
jgi:hypothetical protein